VKGSATGTAGEFLLGNVAVGEYYLVVSYVGYGRRIVSDIFVHGSPKEINLGVINAGLSYKISRVGIDAKGGADIISQSQLPPNFGKKPGAHHPSQYCCQ
jgi:hypothetical protein